MLKAEECVMARNQFGVGKFNIWRHELILILQSYFQVRCQHTNTLFLQFDWIINNLRC